MSPPPVRVTVRFTPTTHGVLQGHAADAGCSLAQWLREAALMRLAWERGLGLGDNATATGMYERAVDELRRVMYEAVGPPPDEPGWQPPPRS